MNRYIKGLLSLLIAVVLTLGILTQGVFAADYVKGANTASESYKSGVYYRNLTAVPLTGDGRLDVVAVALSQLGYQEGASNGKFSGEVAGSSNYTEYNYNMGDFGVGYGGSSYPWCAAFVSFCLLQSGCTTQSSIRDWCRNHTSDGKYIWREVSCQKWASQLRTFGHFKARGSYTPIAGDLIFFTSNGNTESHIGIVLYTDGSKVYTVEGNTSSAAGLETNGGGVYFKSYSLSSTSIVGYGVLPYERVNDAERIDYSGAAPTAGLYMATTNKYVYENEGDSSYKWLLPKYTMFTVTGVASNGRLIAKCTINGVEVNGYIKNNTDRVIQMTVTPTEPDNGGNEGGNSGGNEGGSVTPPEITLSSLSITSPLTRLDYYVGETLLTEGLEVTATYSDGTTEVITDYVLSGFDSATAGEKVITVTKDNISTSFTVAVKDFVDSSVEFSDVAEGAWYKPHVDRAVTYGIVNGNGAGGFSPEGIVTRAQFVQMLANISGVDTTNKKVDAGFPDVKSGAWYAPAVKWAAESGIVVGSDKGYFNPDDELTREQMCLIIVNYVQKYLGTTLDEIVSEKSFDDDAKISSWAKNAVYACQRSGLVTGVNTTSFAPLNTANRASAATLLVKFYEGYVR